MFCLRRIRCEQIPSFTGIVQIGIEFGHTHFFGATMISFDVAAHFGQQMVANTLATLATVMGR